MITPLKPIPSKTAEIVTGALMAPFILIFGACAFCLIGGGLILMKIDDQKDKIKKWWRKP